MFMIKDQMPSIYLEAFNELGMSKNLKWPDNPKILQQPEFDETFKLYSAKD